MRLDGLVAEAGLAALDLIVEISGDPSTEVLSLTMDSRGVTAGAMFACVPGHTMDGHEFAGEAVAAGAAALLCERRLEVGVPQVVVTSVRRSLGPVADAIFGHPSRQLTVVGVTGTNGKTTTCALLSSVFDTNGWPSTTIGTLTQQRTTPEAPELQALLAGWRDRGGRAIAMEVSSHALDQHRTDALSFAAGVFTNLTPEHLDYHETMDQYFEAKARLFEPGSVRLAVVNTGDAWGSRLAEQVRSSGLPVAEFSLSDASDLELRPGGSTFVWEGHRLVVNLGGRFNVENALAAATCARSLGIETDAIAAGLASLSGVQGRFQVVDAGQPFSVIVDYAHTPDGLSKALMAARELGSGKLIVVFGAGGDRDHEKRPLMGAAASRLADLAVITSDNPRSEDPMSIIDQILTGAEGNANVVTEPDRAAAIATALANASGGDVVLIAGKGHERGQDIGGRVVPFDDVEVANAAIARILASRRPGE
ncbi:MAG TPA: UDP-N-acetylmuramoyl-L-alanyl-D-glutamate--2,6-diaminopimelate ligase [Acidimicrobiales bacterium]|nr:UDP-N-acetylmuramoyl-L-alanyl-D-glutamate--2,6-diaminopimelate ligase [Acidimicrobiales bacterium]